MTKILEHEGEQTTKLIKEMEGLDRPSKNSLLQELIDKAFEGLYDGQNLYSRAISMKEKINGPIQDVLDANPLDEILPEIRDSNKIIVSPISGVIQTSIDRWSKVLREGQESKLPPIFSKLGGNDKGVCSEICSHLNLDEVKVFLNAFSFRITPIIGNNSSTSNLVKVKAPKRAKTAHFEKVNLVQEPDSYVDYTPAASSSSNELSEVSVSSVGIGDDSRFKDSQDLMGEV